MKTSVFFTIQRRSDSCIGGVSQPFDEGSMTRKVFTQKKHVQAPRNSLELQIEASNRCAVRGHTPFYCVDEFQSERMRNQPVASMKKLIKDEISSRSTNSIKHRSPSIVARLMGMDVLPTESGSVMSTNIKEKESTRSDLSRRKNSISSGQATRNPSYDEPGLNTESYNRKSNQKDERTWRREHPQEEELQKFKKEFEAWQAARFRECSQFVNLDQIPSRSGAREKPSHAIAIMKPSERDYTHNFGTTIPQKSGFGLPLRKFEDRSVDCGYATISGDKSNDFLHPTRIVILKPGPDTIWSNDESLTSSSGSDERGSSIEDFLHEVKERLKHELQGKALNKSSVVRGSGIKTPFREKPSFSEEVAQNMVNQARDRDIELDLRRSGSTRSYRSEMYLTEPWSPEFIHKDTRRFLSERLRNVVKGDKYSKISEEGLGGSTSRFIDYHQWDEKERNYYPKNVDEEHEIQVRSSRHGSSNDMPIHKELSPRNLVRSMSAPVSGTSFGKLLLEDRQVLTGAHIRRKQEACESHPRDAKKMRREKFNFKERVHNIKYTFTLRRKLFGKRIPSIEESRICEPDFFKDMSSGPTVLTNFGERFENSTEVPPSPASVCSSAQDEYWRPSSNLSPISTPDLSHAEDFAVPGVFRDISMNLNELRRQLNQLASDEPIATPIEQWTAEPEMPELDDKVESYIRDLLVASGWYDGSPELCVLKWDSLSRPISDLAFKDAEECYRNSAKNYYNDIQENGNEEKAMKIDHKLLHDLLNEVLPSVLSPAKSKNACFTPIMVPRGSDLLCSVWEIVRELVYPRAEKSCCYSMEVMASWDLKSNPWMCLLDDLVAILCREVETLIAEELVEEVLKELGCKSF